MKTDIIKKAEELDKQCEYFLNRYTPETKTRVAQEGIEPLLRVVREILNLPGVAPINVMEVAQLPIGKGKEGIATVDSEKPTALIRIGVYADGRLVSMVTSMDVPFRVARPPAFVTLDELLQVDVTAYKIVQNMRKLAYQISVEGSATQAGGIA